jgi:hypothetical protein
VENDHSENVTKLAQAHDVSVKMAHAKGWEKPGFLKKKTSPVGFLGFFLGFIGFYCFFLWVLLGFLNLMSVT